MDVKEDWYSKQYEHYRIEDQKGIDEWLKEFVGYGNYCEWLTFYSTQTQNYRSFSFKDSRHATMFMIKFS